MGYSVTQWIKPRPKMVITVKSQDVEELEGGEGVEAADGSRIGQK